MFIPCDSPGFPDDIRPGELEQAFRILGHDPVSIALLLHSLALSCDVNHLLTAMTAVYLRALSGEGAEHV